MKVPLNLPFMFLLSLGDSERSGYQGEHTDHLTLKISVSNRQRKQMEVIYYAPTHAKRAIMTKKTH
jgi:hypothetical protein